MVVKKANSVFVWREVPGAGILCSENNAGIKKLALFESRLVGVQRWKELPLKIYKGDTASGSISPY